MNSNGHLGCGQNMTKENGHNTFIDCEARSMNIWLVRDCSKIFFFSSWNQLLSPRHKRCMKLSCVYRMFNECNIYRPHAQALQFHQANEKEPCHRYLISLSWSILRCASDPAAFMNMSIDLHLDRWLTRTVRSGCLIRILPDVKMLYHPRSHIWLIQYICRIHLPPSRDFIIKAKPEIVWLLQFSCCYY